MVIGYFTSFFCLRASSEGSCNHRTGVWGDINAPRVVLMWRRLGIGRYMPQNPNFKKGPILKCILYRSSEGPLLNWTPVSHSSDQLSNTSSLCRFQGMVNHVATQKFDLAVRRSLVVFCKEVSIWSFAWKQKPAKNGSEGFPGGAVVESLPANAGDTGRVAPTCHN